VSDGGHMRANASVILLVSWQISLSKGYMEMRNDSDKNELHFLM
jgi:hypothetical protein